MKRKNKYLIIDGNYLCHVAFHSTRSLKHNDINTGVIFGFFNQIINMAEVLNCGSILFAWDSQTSFRKDYYPGYKEKRIKDRKEYNEDEKEALKLLYKQMGILRKEIIPALGFNNSYLQEGLEGDDIMASLVFDKRYQGIEFVLVASDHDLYQLLSCDTWMYMPGKKRYTVEDFKEEFKISPADWKRVKAIGGCATDSVPGVPGVGEKTVCRYLRGELPDHYAKFNNIVCKKGRKLEKFNKILVHLPHPETKEMDIVKDELNFKAFKKMCKKFGFKSFLSERKDEWKRLFKGKYRR